MTSALASSGGMNLNRSDIVGLPGTESELAECPAAKWPMRAAQLWRIVATATALSIALQCPSPSSISTAPSPTTTRCFRWCCGSSRAAPGDLLRLLLRGAGRAALPVRPRPRRAQAIAAARHAARHAARRARRRSAREFVRDTIEHRLLSRCAGRRSAAIATPATTWC